MKADTRTKAEKHAKTRTRQRRVRPQLQHIPPREAILTEEEELALTRLSRTTRWRLTRAGKYPAQVCLTATSRGRICGEVLDWLAARAAERPAA